MIRYSTFKTLFGWMGVIEGEKGLKKIILPYSNRSEVRKLIAQEFADAIEDDNGLEPVSKIFLSYFKGERITQALPLDWSGKNDFSITVWKATQTISWGEVRTYKWLSLNLKRPRSFRAVGTALGKNPFPIVAPCHRVVRSDGELGGFSAPDGIVLKRKLLEMEGVKFDKNGRVII